MATPLTPDVLTHNLATLGWRPQARDILAGASAVGDDGRWLTARGRHVALQSRRPLDDAGRQLAGIAASGYPTHLVVIGLGLGHVLDVIERWPMPTRVLAIEPDTTFLGAFLSRRDWTGWLAERRLQIIVGPDYADARRTLDVFGATSIPPVTVHPVLAREAPQQVLAARMRFDTLRYDGPLDPREPRNSQSMLHHSVLVLLEHAAATAQAGILEIGSYIGGSTMAICRGLRQSLRPVPFWTLEKGIAHPTHPHLPTDDSFAHLQRNLREARLERYATLVKGEADAPAIVQPLQRAVAEAGLSLLLIDADGEVARDFSFYLPFCRPGCLVVVDDYDSEGAREKMAPTRDAIHRLVAAGVLQTQGVMGWGTWVGNVRAIPPSAFPGR